MRGEGGNGESMRHGLVYRQRDQYPVIIYTQINHLFTALRMCISLAKIVYGEII